MLSFAIVITCFGNRNRNCFAAEDHIFWLFLLESELTPEGQNVFNRIFRTEVGYMGIQAKPSIELLVFSIPGVCKK